jgi:hypothetical protein
MGERGHYNWSGLNQEIAELFFTACRDGVFVRRNRAEEVAALRGTLGADAGEDA